MVYFFFFFNDTATTEIYTLSLHDALPIWVHMLIRGDDGNMTIPTLTSAGYLFPCGPPINADGSCTAGNSPTGTRSEEHTSELQSHLNLVCRLLLEKKKT